MPTFFAFRPRVCRTLLGLLGLSAALASSGGAAQAAVSPANRLVYLDEFSSPFHPSANFPRLLTPQWVGEPGVEVVVTYGIDDMRNSAPYEQFLRPILERLKRVDGRAPVSIFCNALDVTEPRLQSWLTEGLSFEVHTLSHPCPILAQGNFTNAQNTFHGGVELLHQIPKNVPVAFRTPCCDSIDSASPRLFAELFGRRSPAGHFLRMDSSVTLLLTTNDPALPSDRLFDGSGRPRFQKYVPFEAFSTIIENYPYPYVHTRVCWEMPFVAPSDWQSHNIQSNASPQMLEDWKVALDLIALKQGVFNYVFHPTGWSSPTQHVAFIDYATARYGSKVKFLNYREVHERLTRDLLAGQPLRSEDGGDNGVRLLDLNNDGYMDVVIGNEHLRRTRLWQPEAQRWADSEFPTVLVERAPVREVNAAAPAPSDAGVRFGVLGDPAHPVMLVRNERGAGAWRFREGAWQSDVSLWEGLELEGQPLFTARGGRERGVRLRDVDGDGVCEFIVANEEQSAVFNWDDASRRWRRASYGLPAGALLVNAAGEERGMRFLDLNQDGAEDVLVSNEERYSVHLMVPRQVLGFQPGWSREVIRGRRGQLPELPPVARGGAAPNNGAWFTETEMYVQNEDTARLPHLVDRRAFRDILNSFMPPALGPTQALATIAVPDGFTIELVAHEPLVLDPVCLDWSEDGRLWVVEMRDYPLGLDGKGKPGGAIRVLEDRDGDGRYETSSLFAEGLNFPNGILPWRKGVLVSAAPDILYLEDTDGDGKADKVDKLFTGFVEGNQQHRCNGFDYGLDNWIYGANGDSGGTIRSVRSGVKIGISGRDFRFRPDDGGLETIEGQTQFGRHRDDWGNWFGNANPVWLWHYWLPEFYVRRNPQLAVASLRRETATYPEAGRVLSIGRKPQRFNDVGTAGYVTSANSPTPYRDTLFGEEFANAVFISEPVYNLVRCEILEPAGVSFTSRRWHSEQPREFIASSDPWFRPTGLKIGPDGALYLADMYRQFIEHPEWIPGDIKNRYNLRAGEDKGRIYRVYPKGQTLRATPRLDRLNGEQLVAALEHPNGWQRTTVQRLLVAGKQPGNVAALQNLLRHSPQPKTRVSILATLDGLGALSAEDVTRGLTDAHPGVREFSVRLAERFMSVPEGRGAATAPPLATAEGARLVGPLLAITNDPALRVRYQLALSLGEWDDARAAMALATLAEKDLDHAEVLTAIASSATKRPGEILGALLRGRTELSRADKLLRNLVSLVAGRGGTEVDAFITLFASPASADGTYAPWQLSGFAQLLQELKKAGRSMADFPAAARHWPALRKSAWQLTGDNNQPLESRVSAVPLLGRAEESQLEDAARLASLCSPAEPDVLQRAALAQLRQLPGNLFATALLKAWRDCAPAIREAAVGLMVRRAAWTELLLDGIERHMVLPDEVGAGPRQQLLNHASPELRARAQKSLALTANHEREKLIASYLPLVKAAAGEASLGAVLFSRHCAVCHRLNQQGTGAAPDLATVVDRSPERMLVSILDPSRAVEARYLAYEARTKAGEEFSGMLASESANSVTLVSVSGVQETLLRAELESLTATRVSIMPEGFEAFLKPKDVADLIAFLDSVAVPPRFFPGNHPELSAARPDGALWLNASNAAIYGNGLAFEAHYHNLGYWNSPLSRATWAVQVPRPGAYEVWLRWACQEAEAGNRFRLQVGDTSLSARVPGTGTWDDYQFAKFGVLNLPGGTQRASIQAETPLRGFLMDLLEVRLLPVGSTP
jgi:putative membrane-bound dehydrogenase-like protein